MMERLASWNSAGALSQKRGGTYRLPGKAQGSRAVLIAGRDPERVQKRFGSVPGQQGAYYTRASKASPSHRSMSGTTRGRMLPAPGLQVAICGTCQAKLDGPEPPPPLCAFNGVHPLESRPLVLPAGVLVEARLLPAVELPPQRRFLAGQFLWRLGRMLRIRTAITGKSG